MPPDMVEKRGSMSDSGKSPELQVRDQLAPALENGIRALVRALVQKDEEQYESEFVHLLARVRELEGYKAKAIVAEMPKPIAPPAP